MTRYVSLTLLLASSLIRQLRSFTKGGTSEADCLYLTKKPAVVMEPQYTSTLLQFSALHEHVHPTSWLAILFFFYARLWLKCCFWDLLTWQGSLGFSQSILTYSGILSQTSPRSLPFTSFRIYYSQFTLLVVKEVVNTGICYLRFSFQNVVVFTDAPHSFKINVWIYIIGFWTV